MNSLDARRGRVLRHQKIRSKLAGTKERPRLSVYRSSKSIYAQIIDDEKGITLASVSTKEIPAGAKTERSKEAGILLAKRAKEAKVKNITFDRGGYKFHGRVASLAAGVKEGGFEF